MLRIAICEDDILQAGNFESMLGKVMGELHINNIIDVYTSAKTLQKYIDNGKNYDAYFLDIELGDGSGIDIAKNIRSKDMTAVIIFTTGYGKYMAEAFDIHAYHYLMKPFKEDCVVKLMAEIAALIKTSKHKFSFSYKREEIALETKDIIAMYSEKRIINIKELKNEYVFYGKIDDTFDLLPHSEFVKIRSGCIVNMNYIKKIEKNHIWCYTQKGLIELSISRRYHEQFMHEYRLYMRGKK